MGAVNEVDLKQNTLDEHVDNPIIRAAPVIVSAFGLCVVCAILVVFVFAMIFGGI
jgi:hypothetical protein